MRNKSNTRNYYINQLGFKEIGDYAGYLILQKDNIETHFFEQTEFEPKENYGHVYIRTDNINDLYKSLIDNKTEIHPNGKLKTQRTKGICIA